MIKLDYIEKENKGVVVKVYDGDVNYQNSDKWNNFCYYFDERGKRVKTRPYAQWTAMYGRCSENGSYKKRFDAYKDAHCSELFSNYDSWIAWAETKLGFMCLDENGKIFEQDKDLFGDGNLYSEDTCCFVPRNMNQSLRNYRTKTVKEKRELFSRVFDEWFDCLDDAVLEFFIKESNHTHTILSEGRLTQQEQEEKESVNILYSVCLNIKDDVDVMSGVTFNGAYSWAFLSRGVRHASKKSFTCVRECVIEKLENRIDTLEKSLSEIFERKKFRDENKDKMLVEKLENIKSNLDGVKSGLIDLPQYISVSSLKLKSGEIKVI